MTGPAEGVIERLGLRPHPEGGWYRETWRGPTGDNGRAIGTAIHFLLEAGQASHWHRVDATEIWLWHAGSPLVLALAEDEKAEAETMRLGPEVLDGERPQQVVPTGCWQAARAGEGWALVSCVVVPGFEFSGFTLAPPKWEPGPAR